MNSSAQQAADQIWADSAYSYPVLFRGRVAADPSLSDLEVYLFFSLLFSAGAETTRNAVAGGLLALAQQ